MKLSSVEDAIRGRILVTETYELKLSEDGKTLSGSHNQKSVRQKCRPGPVLFVSRPSDIGSRSLPNAPAQEV
jgi:hypothetical protein